MKNPEFNSAIVVIAKVFISKRCRLNYRLDVILDRFVCNFNDDNSQ